MRTAAPRLLLVGTLGLTGLAGGVVLGPALAGAAPALTQTVTPEAPEQAPSPDRTARLREHLQALVDAGTIDAAQADAVAAHLAEQLPTRGGHGHGRGGRGAHLALDVAAETLGVTEDELRTALQSGSSLADVADAEGVELDTLVTALVDAARERLAQGVADGRLTQEQADERAADLQARVEEHVQREGLGRRGAPPADAPAEDGAVEPSSFSTA